LIPPGCDDPKSFVEGGELGKVFYVKAGWLKKESTQKPWLKQKEKAGGEVLLDLGIVMIDLAMWMLGYPVGMRISGVNFKHTTKKTSSIPPRYSWL